MMIRGKLLENSVLIIAVAAIIIAALTMVIALLLFLGFLQREDGIDLCHMKVKELEKELVRREYD